MGTEHVYIVRHAKAEPEGSGGDAARALTRVGRDRFQALLAALAPRLRVTRIVTSPLVRARQTADLLARATGAPVEEDERLASGSSSARAILDLLRGLGAGAAVVGHNPELADAVALVARREVRFSPGSIAAVELGPPASLAWVEAPPPAGD